MQGTTKWHLKHVSSSMHLFMFVGQISRPKAPPKVLLPRPPPPTPQVFLPTQLQLKRRADLTLAYLLSCAHLASLAAERAS